MRAGGRDPRLCLARASRRQTPPCCWALVIGFEAFGVGLGTAAFIAYIATTTDPRYTATQFALFTSLAAVPRTFVNAATGYIVDPDRLVQFLHHVLRARAARHADVAENRAVE